MKTTNNRQKGWRGEETAKNYLKQRGYEIVRQNYYTAGGEIDLIVWDKAKNELVFVEVKARANRRFGYPEEAIDDYKLEHIYNSAEKYVREAGYRGVYRFDCVAIEWDGRTASPIIKHYKNIS
jgi:putative endonuclease